MLLFFLLLPSLSFFVSLISFLPSFFASVSFLSPVYQIHLRLPIVSVPCIADISALYDDTSDVEEAEHVDARDRKGVAGSVTSPQGNVPRLPFFKKVIIVIVIKPECIRKCLSPFQANTLSSNQITSLQAFQISCFLLLPVSHAPFSPPWVCTC